MLDTANSHIVGLLELLADKLGSFVQKVEQRWDVLGSLIPPDFYGDVVSDYNSFCEKAPPFCCQRELAFAIHVGATSASIVHDWLEYHKSTDYAETFTTRIDELARRAAVADDPASDLGPFGALFELSAGARSVEYYFRMLASMLDGNDPDTGSKVTDTGHKIAETWQGPYTTQKAADIIRRSEQSIRDYSNGKRPPPPGVEVKKVRNGWYMVKTPISHSIPQQATASPNLSEHR